MSDENLIPRPLKIRKQRQSYTIIPTNRHNPENELAMSLLPSTSRNASSSGMVMATDADRQQAEKSQMDSAPKLCRRPSFKHRLLNRMMSGLATRTQINSIDEEDEQTEHQLSTARTSREVSRGSNASSDPNTNRLNDLDRVLAAFPTPPTSNVTSPSSGRSLESVESQPQTYRVLCRPRREVILAAELKIIPCLDHPMADRSLLALIEISTTTSHSSFDHMLHPQQSALDIAVVIDNSLFNSPASLMASCEIVSLLASFLSTTTDRMMVLCTVPADAKHDTCNPNIILPLSRIHPRKLKAKLDNITISMAQPNPGAMTTVLKDAQRILVKSERLSSIGEPLNNTFGHIVVLTAHISALCVDDLRHQNIQTHLLCVGLPQQREWDEVESNGWKMRMFNAILNRSHPYRSGSKRDRDPHNLNNSLQRLIQYARLGKLTDYLTDVMLDIEPRSGYSIEKTKSWNAYSKIQMGEIKTILVRLQPAGRRSIPNCVDNLRWCHLNASPDGNNSVVESDQMLGLPKDGMMTAKLKYKHSSLPANTTCVTTTKCPLHTPPGPHEDEDLDRRTVSSKAKTLLHQHLAEHYATFFKPRDALLSLQLEFGKGGCQSACPVYMTAVADELRYQARICERMAIENSPKKPSFRFEGSDPGTRIGNCTTPTFYSENCKPRDQISVPDEDVSVPSASHYKVVEQLGLDDARKLWNDLRNMSRGDTKTVLKRGSIGESSLRSLSTPARISANKGLSAPWL